jgi:translation initiation factor eIF-2B subunit beta
LACAFAFAQIPTMQGATIQAPGLSTYLKSLKSTPVDASVEHFIS